MEEGAATHIRRVRGCSWQRAHHDYRSGGIYGRRQARMSRSDVLARVEIREQRVAVQRRKQVRWPRVVQFVRVHGCLVRDRVIYKKMSISVDFVLFVGLRTNTKINSDAIPVHRPELTLMVMRRV